MRITKLSILIILCVSVLLVSGCVDELSNLKIQNNTQRKHIEQLESQVRTVELRLEQAKKQIQNADSYNSLEIDKLNQNIAALEQNIEKKKKLIARMQQQLFYGVSIPVELSTLLEDFAEKQDKVTYDAEHGIVKFESDLLFKKGSDSVTAPAATAIKSLCEILNTKEALQFDIIVAGHTDDIPVRKPATRAKHPTNWHLSSNRAISVLNLMINSNITPQRLSVRGFGEFRPIAKNKPSKKGNPQNRRVEIYIVSKGL